MKKISIDETKLPAVMEIIEKAALLMDEKDCDSDKEAKKYTTDDFEVVKLLDPLAEERNALRYSLIPSMVKIYEYNKARENKDVCIFEIGKGFYKKQEEYGENQKIVALMTGKYYLGVGNSANVDFYVIKGVVEELLNFLGYENRYTIEMPDQIPNEFHKGQTANINVNGQIVGIVGKLHPEVTKDDVYVMEINLDELLSKRVGKMKYKEISKFPNVKKDVAFVMKKDIPSVEVEKVIKKAGGKLLTNIEVFDVYTGENIGKDEKSVAYSLTFNDSKKTLTEEEITKIFENIIANVEKLNDVAGLGPKKIDKYGEAIIEVVNKYVEENNIDVEWKEKKKKKLILDGESRKPKEIALDLLNQGIDVKTVSNKLEVSVSSILGYICEYIKDKNELHFKFNPTIYYCDDEKELIQKSINKFGEDKLKDIKQSLPDYIKYESIRAVIIEKYIS